MQIELNMFYKEFILVLMWIVCEKKETIVEHGKNKCNVHSPCKNKKMKRNGNFSNYTRIHQHHPQSKAHHTHYSVLCLNKRWDYMVLMLFVFGKQTNKIFSEIKELGNLLNEEWNLINRKKNSSLCQSNTSPNIKKN